MKPNDGGIGFGPLATAGIQAEAEKRLYTLEEAACELARRECAQYGHSFDEIIDVHEPVAVFCHRCGKHWDVKAGPKPEDAQATKGAA